MTSSVIVTPSIYAQGLAACRKVGAKWNVDPFTTVTEELNNSTAVPFQPTPNTLGLETYDPYDPNADTAGLLMRYLMIGNRGHYTWYGDNSADGVPAAVEHATSDSGLYRPIPFICVPIDQDLTASQRAIYRLRKVLSINGSLYVAYYARILDLTTTTPIQQMYHLVNNQIVDQTPFVATVDNNVPQHPVGDLTNDNTHIAITIPYAINFTTDDINNIINACTLLFGDARYAFISELVTCHGIDKQVNTRYPTSGAQNPTAVPANTYYEVAGCQVDTSVCLTQSLSQNQVGFGISLQVGGGRPLFPTSSTGG